MSTPRPPLGTSRASLGLVPSSPPPLSSTVCAARGCSRSHNSCLPRLATSCSQQASPLPTSRGFRGPRPLPCEGHAPSSCPQCNSTNFYSVPTASCGPLLPCSCISLLINTQCHWTHSCFTQNISLNSQSLLSR